MTAADFHALFLLVLIALAAILIWFFGKKTSSGLRALLAFLLIFIVSTGWGAAYAFAPKIIAIKQVLIPALIAMVCAAYIENKWLRWTINIILLQVSMLLSLNFIHLIATDINRCEYTGHTDKYVSYRCNKPAQPYKLWHTWLTSIYGLQLIQK